MFARVTHVQYPAELVEQLEQAARAAGQQVGPLMKSIQGFRGGYWLSDTRGTFIGITVWDTMEAIQQYEAATAQLRAAAAQGNPQQVIQYYEVYETLSP
jgi:heme-degrading monooxygenase HmoA